MRRSRYVIFAVAIFLLGWLAAGNLPAFRPFARAAAALVQKNSAVSSGNGVTTLTATFTSAPTQGNLLVAVFGANANVTLSGPAGWSQAINESGSPSQAIFYKVAGAGESSAVTATTSASSQLGLHIYEYSGVSTSFPLDQTASATGNSTSTNGASVTTTQPDEVIIAASTISAQTTFSSWNNSFTKETDVQNSTGANSTRTTYSGADRIVNSAGAYSSVGAAGISATWRGQIVSFRAQINLTQAAFRWFANTSSTSVGSPLALQNLPMTQLAPGTPFRLRMLINVAADQLGVLSRSFKLQYVNEGTGTCASPSGNAYADVTTSTGPIRFFSNSGANNGDPLAPTSTDPVDATNTIVNETYVSANTFSNASSAVPVGEDGKWDFPLVDNNASSSATYCFQAVESNGTAFAAYSAYPTVVIGDITPTIGSVSLNGNSDIALTVATTTPIQATATVVSANGYTNLATVTAKFYRTSLGNNCAADNNNCYQISNCPLSSCAGTSCTATCTGNLWYFAEPTDSGTPWAGDSWTAALQANDKSNETSTIATSTAVNLLTLLGLQVASSVSYGSFNPGQSLATLTIPTAITNIGNAAINATIYGINMTAGANSIALGNQHYATASIAYASGTTLLASPGTTTLLAMPKTTASSTPASATIYWGVSVPNPQPAGTFSGMNTFIAVEKSLPWP